MTVPSDEPPVSRPPRSRQGSEPFLKGPAEQAIAEAKEGLRSLPPPAPPKKLGFPRWAKAGAVIAFVLSLVRWLLGAR